MGYAWRPYVPLALFASAVAAPGCSDSYGGRKEVSGVVKLVGEPINDGMIEFKPLDKENQETRQGAQINNGEYKVPRKQGLKPGKYLVSISSGDSKVANGERALDDAGGPSTTNRLSVDRVPEDWNINSKQQVEVKADGVNKFDFEIPNYHPRYLRLKKK
jgi:hypothetical protein